jgi:hypothetical protein
MVSRTRAVIAQPSAELISAEAALAIARERFSNLGSAGILGSKKPAGTTIDLAHVERALAFLARCRKSKIPNVHSHDLRAAIGGVSQGAVIVAAHALGFPVHSWLGTRTFAPGALIGVNATDVRRITA